jgi:ATP-dependent Clp protease ATP-binding subunit ClpC
MPQASPEHHVSSTEQLPFSTRLRVALALARGIAAARGDVDLTPVHAALGLLREGENAAVGMLQHADIPLNRVRYDLEVALGEAGRPRPEEVALPLSDGERGLVLDARRQARLRGDPFVGPEHMLLALLHSSTSPAAQIFIRHGFSHDAGLAHLAAILVQHERPPDAPGPVT